MQRIRRLETAVALALALALPGTSFAQAKPGEWEFGAVLYGWFPSLGGSTQFPAGSGPSINVSADSILEHLKFVFLGTLEASKDRIGMFADVIYMDLGGSKSGTREIGIGQVQLPADVTANASLDVKSWVVTMAGTYRVAMAPAAPVDVFAGARLLDLEQTLDYQLDGAVGPIPLPARGGKRSVEVGNRDGIVGAKGRLALDADRKWFVPWHVDVGTGESDLTWQAVAGLGYRFSWGSVIAALGATSTTT